QNRRRRRQIRPAPSAQNRPHRHTGLTPPRPRLVHLLAETRPPLTWRKLQAPKHSQSPNLQRPRLHFGAWRLVFHWSLERLEFGASAARPPTAAVYQPAPFF